MAKGSSVGKNTFWPGHAPWATASSGVPAGALHKLSLARDLPASLRRASKIRKKEKPFSKFNYKYFSAMLFASVVFYPRLFFLCFECSAMFSDFFSKIFSLYQCEVLKQNGLAKSIVMMHTGSATCLVLIKACNVQIITILLYCTYVHVHIMLHFWATFRGCHNTCRCFSACTACVHVVAPPLLCEVPAVCVETKLALLHII